MYIAQHKTTHRRGEEHHLPYGMIVLVCHLTQVTMLCFNLSQADKLN